MTLQTPAFLTPNVDPRRPVAPWRQPAQVPPPGGVPSVNATLDSARRPRALPSQLATVEDPVDVAAPTPTPLNAPLVQQLSLVVGTTALGWYLGNGQKGALLGAALGAGVLGGMQLGVLPAPASWVPTGTPST